MTDPDDGGPVPLSAILATWAERSAPVLDQPQLPGIDPEIPATRSKALEGAWRKGRAAALEGRGLDDCPYRDKRCGEHGHIVTFSRAFRRWWRDGFESVTLFPIEGVETDGA